MNTLDKKYYKIRDVAEMIGVPCSTLRFWEKEFSDLRPKRNDGGTRFYTPRDVEIVRMIHYLVKEKGLKIDAARDQLHRNRSGVEKRHETIRRLQEIRGRLISILKALDSRR